MKLGIRTYKVSDEASVIDLWQQCNLTVPWNNPQSDIARKMADSPDLFFVGTLDMCIVSSCMAGYDGHRGWIYYLAVLPDLQNKGIAAQMLTHSERVLAERGCPKINLMVRNTNQDVIQFYQRAGFSDESVLVLSKRLSEDSPSKKTA